MPKNYRNLEEFLIKNKIDYSFDYQFGKSSSFNAGGTVDLHITVKNIETLLNLLDFLNKNNINYFIIRDMNNFLISDEGYKGVLISLKGDFESFEFIEKDILIANGSAILERLSHEARIRNLSGLEFVALVNSRIESAIYSKLESFGISLINIVKSVKVLNKESLSIKELSKEEYISLKDKDSMTILSAALQLEKDIPESIDNRIDWFRYVRGSVAPMEANIGPVFEDFEDIKAYEMVERVGGLDMKSGSVKWHSRFPNYIVNESKCSNNRLCKTSDVISLIDDTRKKIEQHYALKPKINIILLK